jgi:hypothetical protein
MSKLDLIKYYKIKNNLIEESTKVFEKTEVKDKFPGNMYLIDYICNIIENNYPKLDLNNKIHFFFLIYEKEFNLSEDDYKSTTNSILYLYNRRLICKKKNNKWYSFTQWILLKSIRFGENQLSSLILPTYLTIPLYSFHVKHTIIEVMVLLGLKKIVAGIIIGFIFA